MVAGKIVWSAKAKNDVKNILEFFNERNGNTKYSFKLLGKIKKTALMLRKNNKVGKPTDFENTRVIIEGDYLLFYTIEKHIIEILTVWDSKQDPEKLKL